VPGLEGRREGNLLEEKDEEEGEEEKEVKEVKEIKGRTEMNQRVGMNISFLKIDRQIKRH
jgi:hypothetical protein